jgi:hypothetical protein
MGWIILGLIYIALVIAFFVYLGGPLLALTGVCFAIGFVGLYLNTLFEVMVKEPSPVPAPVKRPPSETPPDGEEPAYRQYFFGQALADLTHTATVAFGRCRDVVTKSAVWINESLFSDLVLGTWPLGVVAYAGLVVGALVGGLVVGLVAVIHATVVLLLQACAWVLAYVLRFVDTGLRRVRKIRIHCPTCFEEVTFPAYDCPAETCSIRHGDVRPGAYGVFRRVCFCKTRMPTLIILGSHRLQAYCPHCDNALAEATGTSREVVLPVLGGTAAGKTRLMASMVMALDEMASDHGASLVFADDHTKREYERHRTLLVAGENTRATQATQAPRAYSVYVKPRSGTRRLVHIFDPAGELHNEIERMQELQYLRSARTFLFVVDPLSIESYWSALTDEEQAKLEPERPDPRSIRSPEFVFTSSCDNIQRMEVKTNKARLAVAVSKRDLLGDLSVQSGVDPSSESIERWLRDELGLGNMLRSMKHNFGSVAFHFTAAVRHDDGKVDSSIIDLMSWVFERDHLVFTSSGAASAASEPAPSPVTAF